MLTVETRTTLCLTAARTVADAALDAATAMGILVHVTVMDAAGEVLVYQRMPGAPPPARLFSENKAYTALCYARPTSAWKQRLAENPHLATGLSRHPRVTMIAGGLPIRVDGAVVGAIGIAGGREEEDEAIAAAALKTVGAE